jgi:hypothetical protein
MLIIIELLFAEFVICCSVFFFFVQSPALFGLLGREKFVPIMMYLTKHVFFVYVPLASLLATAFALYNTSFNFSSLRSIFSLASCSFASVNCFIVVPRALQAGAATIGNRKGDNTNSAVEFASTGGAKQGTKFWHRTVVLFVLLMVTSSFVHSVQLVAL